MVFNSKKGLAEIITVILIILLSLAAIAIIWTVIKPVILKTTSQISLACTTGLDIKISQTNCSGNIWSVKVSRDVGEGKIKSIKFVFAADDSSKTVELTKLNQDASGSIPGMPDELSEITYKFNKSNLSLPLATNKVSIAPVVEGEGGADVPCKVLSSLACSQ